jgi:hypothetical protein
MNGCRLCQSQPEVEDLLRVGSLVEGGQYAQRTMQMHDPLAPRLAAIRPYWPRWLELPSAANGISHANALAQPLGDAILVDRSK